MVEKVFKRLLELDKMCELEKTLKQQQKITINKLCVCFPRTLRNQLLVKKVQKRKDNQGKTVCLQARNGKYLHNKRNPKANFPS